MESERVKACLQKAAECEQRAALAGDDTNRKTYRELANQWRSMAKEVEELERRLRQRREVGEILRMGLLDLRHE